MVAPPRNHSVSWDSHAEYRYCCNVICKTLAMPTWWHIYIQYQSLKQYRQPLTPTTEPKQCKPRQERIEAAPIWCPSAPSDRCPDAAVQQTSHLPPPRRL